MTPERRADQREPSEYLRRLRVRANASQVAGDLSSEELSFMLRKFMAYGDIILPEIIASFRDTPREQEGKQEYPTISRPLITALNLQIYSETGSKDVVNAMEQILAKPQISEEDKSVLVYSYLEFDFWQGFDQAITSIRMGEESIAGNTEKNLAEIFPKMEEQIPFDMNASTETDLFLLMRKQGLHFAKLLKKDPTGKLLMHDFTEDEVTKRNPIWFIDKFMNLAFMIEGVKFAEKAYNAVYPLTERI